MTQYVPAFLVVWVGLLIAYWIEHLLWKDLDFRLRYIIGLGTFCAGLLFFGLLIDDPLFVIAPGLLASSGLIVIALYRNEDEMKKREQEARRAGELTGMARGLTQELIDAGGIDAKPGMDRPFRKN